MGEGLGLGLRILFRTSHSLSISSMGFFVALIGFFNANIRIFISECKGIYGLSIPILYASAFCDSFDSGPRATRVN